MLVNFVQILLSYHFFGSHCIYQHREKNIVRMFDGLYYFEEGFSSNKITQGLSSISSLTVHEKIMLWHHRLGHPNFFLPSTLVSRFIKKKC